LLLPLAVALVPQNQTPRIERLDPALDKLIDPAAKIETLAEGYDWSEGPIWVKEEGGYLLFSDVPQNVVYKWKEGAGAQPYLKPSGYTGTEPRGGEMGSNGLTLDSNGRLVLCQHGDRRVARMDAPLSAPQPKFATLADRYDGKRFNSPNDVVFHSNGDMYFTDPPYGMPKQFEDPAREIPFQGVFRRGRDGTVTLLTREMTRPNGLAFSPDEKLLYVAQSDSTAAIWRVFDVKPDGTLGASRVLFDATAMTKTLKGLPDGLKIDTEGNLFATGPGGVLVISPQGKHLGTISTGQATSNCAFGDDGRTLYITADMYLMRVRLKAKGRGF
jgi:gluconolactonase